jgi:hypothetical protein
MKYTNHNPQTLRDTLTNSNRNYLPQVSGNVPAKPPGFSELMNWSAGLLVQILEDCNINVRPWKILIVIKMQPNNFQRDSPHDIHGARHAPTSAIPPMIGVINEKLITALVVASIVY